MFSPLRMFLCDFFLTVCEPEALWIFSVPKNRILQRYLQQFGTRSILTVYVAQYLTFSLGPTRY